MKEHALPICKNKPSQTLIISEVGILQTGPSDHPGSDT
jgi:hypothetical protein